MGRNGDPTASPTRIPANLELTDIQVVEDNATGRLIMKVRNTGEELALVTDVEISIEEITGATLSGEVLISRRYDVEFPYAADSFPRVIPVDVSQVVAPVGADSFDSFELTVVVEEGAPNGFRDYTFRARILYNKDLATPWSDPTSVRIFTSERP
ncbi:MAG: hypothetical protein DWG79_01725 [Chloroflexi bacterium]|nr:hypothetical protein [Chloroflexota bacterium]